jgi:hypothetical protein
MQCNEIKERFIELLYQEPGTPSASPELQAHLSSCPACQKELAGLKELQATLKLWQDEPPMRPTVIPRPEPVFSRILFPVWKVVRYPAIAALVILAFLGLSNAQIRWDKDGFSFKTGLRPQAVQADYYTRDEMKGILENVIDISGRDNFRMMQYMLNTVDAEQAMELRAITRQIKENHIRN